MTMLSNVVELSCIVERAADIAFCARDTCSKAHSTKIEARGYSLHPLRNFNCVLR